MSRTWTPHSRQCSRSSRPTEVSHPASSARRNAVVRANSSRDTNTPLVLKAMPNTTQPRARKACLVPSPRAWRSCDDSASTMASCNGTALSAADHQLKAGIVSGQKRYTASGSRMPMRGPNSDHSRRNISTATSACRTNVTEATSSQS